MSIFDYDWDVEKKRTTNPTSNLLSCKNKRQYLTLTGIQDEYLLINSVLNKTFKY